MLDLLEEVKEAIELAKAAGFGVPQDKDVTECEKKWLRQLDELKLGEMLQEFTKRESLPEAGEPDSTLGWTGPDEFKAKFKQTIDVCDRYQTRIDKKQLDKKQLDDARARLQELVEKEEEAKKALEEAKKAEEAPKPEGGEG